MFEPIRGGTRGGQAEFKWSDVSADKDRENYLGHSINAPTGRWQKNKDVHWYSRDASDGAAERAEEIRKIKEIEADALAVALGFEPAAKTGATVTGSNATPIASTSKDVKMIQGDGEPKSDDKRRRKEEKKEEKRARKALKKLSQSGAHSLTDLEKGAARRQRSRSRSPRYRSRERRNGDDRRPRSRSRSRTPLHDRHGRSTRRGPDVQYDAIERDRGRDADRRRWDLNNKRDLPPNRRRY